MSELPILRIEGLNKTYGAFTALHDINLDVAAGEFLTIVGPSGSGKTTLIKLLVGMEEQTSGAIWLRDQRLDHLPAHKRPTCMVFQSLALFPHRTVGQNIEFPLKIRGEAARQREARARELLELLRLPQDFHTKRIDECSGGERQRVALARALAFDPEILFFDEPLSALDYRLRKTLEKELKALHERTGKTFVYITHSLEEAMVMSDRIAILRSGRFEQIGSAEQIYSRPSSRFVASFMGDVNLFDVSTSDTQDTQDKQGSDQQGIVIEGLDCSPSTSTEWGVDPTHTNTLMVRPENLRFLGEGEHAEFNVHGRITASYLLGSRRQYEIVFDETRTLIAEGSGSAEIAKVGSTVRIGFDRSDAHVIVEPSA